MYRKIMVPLDGSRLAECVLPHVEFLVKSGQVEELVFVRVIEPFRFSSVEGIPPQEDIARLDSEAKAAAESYVHHIAGELKANGASVRGEVLTGNPSEKLAEYANKGNFDLVIIATHGRSGISRWVWGSVADRLLRAVCIPVLMVRAPGCVPGI